MEVQKIINAVAVALDNAFNTEENKYKIYRGEVSQDLIEPCFIIQLVSSDIEAKAMQHYDKNIMLDIAYFHSDYLDFGGILEVLDKLYPALEWIKIEDRLLHCYEFKTTAPEEGVSHYVLSWDISLRRESKKEVVMDEMDRKVIANG